MKEGPEGCDVRGTGMMRHDGRWRVHLSLLLMETIRRQYTPVCTNEVLY